MAMVWRVLKKLEETHVPMNPYDIHITQGRLYCCFFLYPEKNEIKEKKNNLYTRSKKKTARGFPFLEMIKKETNGTR